MQQRAAEICRGTARLLAELDAPPLPEFPLPNGRRADLFALGPRMECMIVEVKSSTADFRSDRKWQEYLEFADRFYFAVGPAFPIDLLPAEEGVIRADRHEAVILRPAIERPLAAARRRSLVLAFARAAARRLHAITDPRPR